MTIKNQKEKSFLSVLVALFESKFEFHLTGSQVFCDKRPEDFDFFVESHPGVESFLIDLGFTSKSDNYVLNDNNLIKVWTFKSHTDKIKIDIQIVADLEGRQKAQNEILSSQNLFKVYCLLTKRGRTYLWNKLLEDANH